MQLKPPKHLEQNIDSWQLISFKGPTGVFDSGDTCANEYSLQYILQFFKQIDIDRLRHVNQQLVVAGVPRRHPNPDRWYSSTNRTSRDQYTPYLCYLVASKSKIGLKTMLQRALRGFIFTWNTRRNFQYESLQVHLERSTPDVQWNYRWKLPDITVLDIWALEARYLARMLHPLAQAAIWPLLCLLDLHGLINVLQAWYRFAKDAESFDYDRRNLSLKVHCAAHYLPTIVSWATWLLYKRSGIGPFTHEKWWTKPGEPALHHYFLRLFK